MMTRPTTPQPPALLLIVACLATLILAIPRAAPAADKKEQTPDAPAQRYERPTDPSLYVGTETCKTCHEDIFKNFESTPHFVTTMDKKRGPEWQGCEACHGPGKEHVEGGGDITKIVNFKGLSQEESSARCLSCHGDSHAQSHFTASAHANSDVGCLDCHSPHHSKEPQRLLIQNQPQLCYGCHTTQKAEFAKPYRHRVDQGLILCSDCHNPHGTGTLRQVKTLPDGDAICYKCHAEKRGPFVYEHVPVKTEGCGSCHTPHASTNSRLLRVSQVNLLCLQCHTVPTQGPAGPAHNLSQKYQACTMCHMGIHGSNFSNVFFK